MVDTKPLPTPIMDELLSIRFLGTGCSDIWSKYKAYLSRHAFENATQNIAYFCSCLMCWNRQPHRKVKVVMTPTLSSLAASEFCYNNLRCCHWRQSWHHDNSRCHSLAGFPRVIPAFVILYNVLRSRAIQGIGLGCVAGQSGSTLTCISVNRFSSILGSSLSTICAFLPVISIGVTVNGKGTVSTHILKTEICHLFSINGCNAASCSRVGQRHDIVNSLLLLERLLQTMRVVT